MTQPTTNSAAQSPNNKTMNTTKKTTIQMPGRIIARNSLHRGQLVIVDGMYQGEITETMIGDGSFYRVEVDTNKEKHEWWTVNFDRMELIPPEPPAKDADTLMRECLEREAKQRAEIAARSINFHGSESTAI